MSLSTLPAKEGKKEVNGSPKPKHLNIGVIGSGYWGPKLARNIHQIPHASLAMVSDLHEPRLQEINDLYFDGRYRVDDVVLIWEQMRKVRPRVLGRFCYPSVIALNPVLDKETIPEEIVKAVLYHEMVHLQLAHDGLPFGHTVEFFQREAEFSAYAKKFHFDFAQAFDALDAAAESKE